MKRRRKNRKKQAQGFLLPVPLTLLLVMVTVTSMTYLWMHSRCEAVGIRIQQLERAKEHAHRRLLDEDRKWAQMKSLPRVMEQVRKHHLDMALAPTHRIIQLQRPAGLESLSVYGELARLSGSGYE